MAFQNFSGQAFRKSLRSRARGREYEYDTLRKVSVALVQWSLRAFRLAEASEYRFFHVAPAPSHVFRPLTSQSNME